PAGADVLAKRTRRLQQRVRADLAGPHLVVVARVMVDGLVRAAMHAAAALRGALQAFEADRHRALARLLGDRAAAARSGQGNGRAGQHGLHPRQRARAHRHVDAVHASVPARWPAPGVTQPAAGRAAISALSSSPRIRMPWSIFSAGTVTNDSRKVLRRGSRA